MKARLLLVLVCALSSCKHISFERRPLEVDRGEHATPHGVEYVELFLGDGPAAALQDTVVFDYTVWLLDGTRVDSTLDRGVPLELPLGQAPIAGLDEGLIGMKPGGRRKLVVPPEMAYGSQGVPDLIPPDSKLEFEVHMIEVRPAK